MIEKEIYTFEELEDLYDARQTFEMRKEYIRNYIHFKLHIDEGNKDRHLFSNLMKLLDFEKSIPQIYKD